jgi:DNA-binding CsgD family transcriptional regulator
VLNHHEIQYILLRCEGLTNKEVARRMFLSPRTIDGYRDKIFAKTGCKNMIQVVAKLMREGSIK